MCWICAKIPAMKYWKFQFGTYYLNKFSSFKLKIIMFKFQSNSNIIDGSNKINCIRESIFQNLACDFSSNRAHTFKQFTKLAIFVMIEYTERRQR